MFSHRVAARLVSGVLLAGLLTGSALAATGTVNTGTANLRVRDRADTNGKILTSLAGGTRVEVLEETGTGWYKISYKGLTGFVSGAYLDVAEDKPAPAQEPQPAQAAPEETPEGEDEAAQYVQVTAAALNVRSGPGTGYRKTGSLRRGATVRVLEESDGWYRIESGYISAQYTQAAQVPQTGETAAAVSDKGTEVANCAMQYLGFPYVYGGSSPKGFDCSGMTKYVYAQYGYTLYRSASDQLKNGVSVEKSELQPGDLVFFRQHGSTRPASHVGLYIGGGNYIHASAPGVGVIVSSLSDMSISSGYVGARRILDE